MQVAAAVTPGRHNTGPAVLDKHGETRACNSAASLGDDVGSTDEIAVPVEAAVLTAESAGPRPAEWWEMRTSS
jgi:hypothetical protein